MKKAYLFPGQGSQIKGMGFSHYQFSETFRKRCDSASEILGYDLTSIMFGDEDERLSQTIYTQPALFVHAYARFEMLRHEPDMVAGHSLGEFTALAVAGVQSFEELLKVVQKRAEWMYQATQQEPGAMLAVIGLEDQQVESICEELSGEDGVVVPANFNTVGQVVVSGHEKAIENVTDKAKEAGAKLVKRLPVSGAFHSPLMASANEPLNKLLDELEFRTPAIPVYSNAVGKGSREPEELKNNLKNQLMSPVRWTQTVQNMYDEGARLFVEVGPGNVLQGLTKRAIKNISLAGFD